MADLFGQRLREFRRAAGISQRELAAQIDVDFSYISKIENGRLPPPAADTIVRMCQVLRVRAEDLLALTGKLPTKVRESLSGSRAAQQFLSEAQRLDLTDDEWREMVKSLHDLRKRLP